MCYLYVKLSNQSDCVEEAKKEERPNSVTDGCRVTGWCRRRDATRSGGHRCRGGRGVCHSIGTNLGIGGIHATGAMHGTGRLEPESRDGGQRISIILVHTSSSFFYWIIAPWALKIRPLRRMYKWLSYITFLPVVEAGVVSIAVGALGAL